MQRSHFPPTVLVALVLATATHAQVTEIIDHSGDGLGNTLDNPQGIAVADGGNVYVVGKSSDNAFKITPQGTIVEIIDAAGAGMGQSLDSPTAVALDVAGNVYVSGFGSDNAFAISPVGGILEIIDAAGDGAGNPLDGTRGVVADAAGNVYVCGSSSDNAFRIRAGGQVSTIIDATGDGTGNVLDLPFAIAVDLAGNVYVTGALSDNVFKIAPSGTITELIDATGDGAGHPLHDPYGIDVAPDGTVYVTGYVSDNAFRIAPDGTITQIIDASGAGPGQGLDGPYGVIVGSAGNVYVTGMQSHNAFMVTPYGQIAQIIDQSGDGAGNPAQYVIDVATDQHENVFVTGSGSDNGFCIENAHPVPGTGYCFGDPGSGTPCPCNNDNDGSIPGSGCYNGVFTSGAQLTGSGVASVNSDSLVLTTTHAEPHRAGLYFQANSQINGGNGITFGDGLRCAGFGLIRLQIRISDAAGASSTTIAIGAKGGVAPGDVKRYQYWYRTVTSPPCGHDFNTSNGYEVTWRLGGAPYDGMVLVPTGDFEMGDHYLVGGPCVLPVHTVSLDSFYMDVYEVTNDEFVCYLNAANADGQIIVQQGRVYQYLLGVVGQKYCETDVSSWYVRITWDGSTFGVTPGVEDHPMLSMSWFGACAYANWCSREQGLTACYGELMWNCNFSADGYRLPTEAEWEYAARGGEHAPYYMYPWGNTLDGSQANYPGSGDPWEGLQTATTPVGYYDGNQIPAGVDMANGYGLYDMAGNAWEYCWDWFDCNYYSNSPLDNPTGPASGVEKILRGGCWGSPVLRLHCSCRQFLTPDSCSNGVGFRLVAAGP